MIKIGIGAGTVDVDWLKIEYNSFLEANKHLQQGFDMILDHTWYAYCYRLLEANPDANILHTHHGGLNWPPYGSPEYPEYLQSAKFNLVAISNFMKRVYKTRCLAGKRRKNNCPIEV